MSDLSLNNVLTLKEVAAYLRLPEEKVEKQVRRGRIPGRKIENEWRFLRAAIDDWLRTYDTGAILLNQAGVFSDDGTSEELRSMIYKWRGRPEAEDS
jgi:excisionase family DNA binding protein